MFACLECGRKFATVKAASRAMDQGCPKCGGSDIDLAPVSTKPPVKKPPVRINPTDLLDDAKFDEITAAARNGTKFTI